MKKLKVAVALAMLSMAWPLNAQTWVSDGYREAVFSVSSLDGYADFLERIGGWQELTRGTVPRTQLQAWGLVDKASATYAVYGNPGTRRGFIRLVQFNNVQQQQIRSSAQSWDTGGWFDVNTRVLDMDQKFAQLQRAEWQSSSDPVRFKFGEFEVIEWLTRGPDGIVFALIERVAPALQEWHELRQFSRIFNATQIVATLPEARAFYEDILGFKPYLEHSGSSTQEGPNVLGLPHSLADEIVRDIVILHPKGSNEGSVELLSFDGVTGADFSARAVPPNLGILMLRFPTDDIAALYAHLLTHETEIAFAPIKRVLEPYGEVRMVGARGPGGALLEFFELLTPPQ